MAASHTVPPTTCFSRVFLVWIGRVILRQRNHQLQDEDWPELHPDLASERVWSRLRSLLGEKVGAGSFSHIDVGSVLWKLVGPSITAGLLAATLRGVLEQGVLPLLIREALKIIGDPGTSIEDVWVFMVAVFLCRFFEAVMESLSFHLVMEQTVPLTVEAIAGLALRKSAYTDPAASQAASVGLQGLLGVDVPTLVARMPLGVMSMTSLGGFISASFVVFYLLGPAAGAVGFVWVVLSLCVAIKTRNRQFLWNRPLAKNTAERVSLMGTFLSTAKGVKIFAWEQQYLELFAQVRGRELVCIEKYNAWWFVASCIGKSVPIMTPLVTFGVAMLSGKELTAAEIFACNMIFTQFRKNVDTLAIAATVVNTIRITLERAQQYMDLPESLPRQILRNCDEQSAPLAVLNDVRIGYKDGAEPGSPKSPSSSGQMPFSLNMEGKQIQIQPGELVAVCGGVGQGKSTLLATLSGSLPSGAFLEGAGAASWGAAPETAYIPQKAFLISGSVQENLLLGAVFDHHKLAKAVETGALVQDLKALSNGLDEEVGERGTALSGGQQARVNFVRAMYRVPRLLAADDVLAAVDAQVARTLLQGVRNFVRSSQGLKSAVMVLNQTYLLSNFDRIIFVQAGNMYGPLVFDQLCESCPAFSAFVHGVKQTEVADECQTDSVSEAALSLTTSSNHKVIDGRPSMKAETVRSNSHGLHLGAWLEYARLAGLPTVWLAILLQVCCWSLQGTRDWWLAYESKAEDSEDGVGYFLVVYAVLGLAQLLCHVLIAILTVKGCTTASRRLHDQSLVGLLKAPVAYFEDTPQGWTLSRFGTDLAQMDSQVAVYLESTVQMVLILAMMSAILTSRLPFMCVLLAVLYSFWWLVCTNGFQTRLAAGRRASAAVGPLYSNLGEMVSGFAVIKIMGLEAYFVGRHYEFADQRNRFNIISVATMNFGRFTVDVCGMTLATAAIISSYVFDMSREDAAIFVSYTVTISMWLMVSNMIFSQLFTFGANLERILELANGDMPQEVVITPGKDETPLPDFKLTRGVIEFKEVSLKYRPGAPLALRTLSVKIEGGQKVGVIGRTGAGKSTLALCLFRLVDYPCLQGSIFLDGFDTRMANLQTLRQALSMIPQEPILMNGTVRFNLDPFGEFSSSAGESKLREAMEKSHLSMLDLDSPVAAGAEGGTGTLSAGERQLLCLARALLSCRKILVADEPTASIDMRTDALIQQLLREAFDESTVLTVAHRIHTVLDYDRILVLEAGQVAEDGHPNDLMRNSNSLLSQYHLATTGSKKQPDEPDSNCLNSELSAFAQHAGCDLGQADESVPPKNEMGLVEL